MSQQYQYNQPSRQQGGGSGGGLGFGGLLVIVALGFGIYNNQRGIIPTNDLNTPFIQDSMREVSSQPSTEAGEDTLQPNGSVEWEGYTGDTISYKESDVINDEDLQVVVNYESLIERLHSESIRMGDETGDESVSQAPQTQSVYFRNCQEVIASGLAPLHKGELGYREALDTNKDGVACEE